MPKLSKRLLLLVCLALPAASQASIAEIFAKGSVSKNYLDKDKWTISVSATTGLAITLIPRIRIEGRFTDMSSLQNKITVNSTQASLLVTDIKSETNIYSVGIDVDILGEKSIFQPFIFVGAGYVVTTRSYYVSLPDGTGAQFTNEPKEQGVSGNLGAGFRFLISKSLALELELFAYGVNVTQPNPLVNLYGTAGIRIFI